MIKDKSVEQIRELFCIEGDFTEEQEVRIPFVSFLEDLLHS